MLIVSVIVSAAPDEYRGHGKVCFRIMYRNELLKIPLDRYLDHRLDRCLDRYLDHRLDRCLDRYLDRRFNHSHSIVATGLGLKSYATLLTPLTSVMMRLTILPRSS